MSDSCQARTWTELYRMALLESDHAKLPSRIEEARRAIQRRAREIWYAGSPETREQRDLDAALRFLHLLGSVAMSTHAPGARSA